MFKYILKRIFLLIPTIFGITLITFLLVNAAPGGPIEQRINQIRMAGGMGTADMGVSERVIEEMKARYGFDQPVYMRYLIWLRNIATLEFGESFSFELPVTEVILSKLPVSLQFGIVSLILTYLICIPLGVLKAVRDGGHFDMISSVILMIMYSIPPLIFGILLIVFFAGGTFLEWFPLGGIYSDDYHYLSWWEKVVDRVHHFVLPLMAYMIGAFSVLTFLMKNSLLEEVKLDYVRTARAKGLEERKVIYKHALRNALIPLATGLSSFFTLFFAGSIIVEQIFNLDGMGLLAYKSVLDRDYNVLMALIFIQSALLLIGRLISDVTYVLIDPRIDFS